MHCFAASRTTSPPTRQAVRGPEGAAFAIRFGARNPLGSARYAQVDGIDGAWVTAEADG